MMVNPDAGSRRIYSLGLDNDIFSLCRSKVEVEAARLLDALTDRMPPIPAEETGRR